MPHISNEAVIMQQRLDMPDVQAHQDSYGITFAAPTVEQMDGFGRLCDTLAAEAKQLQGVYTELGVVCSKPAVLYGPQVFLAAPLTSEQARAINAQETSSVADYCIDVQAELGNVPIIESGERMAHLPSLFSEAGVQASFSETPFHAACGEWAGEQREFWARGGFANRLLIMGKLLDKVGVQLHFEDAFRPVGVQEGLFKRRVAWTMRDHPEWTEEQVIAEAQSKTAVKPRLASHKGGAAVDARLRDASAGQLLDFGHDYPDGGALVFPRTPFVTVEQWQNRQLFQVAAGLSDLTLYVGEDWHVSYGDNLASLDEHGVVRPDYVAKYGPIKDFDRTTGEITAVYDQAEMNQTFPY